jgi:hypothetical protein
MDAGVRLAKLTKLTRLTIGASKAELPSMIGFGISE